MLGVFDMTAFIKGSKECNVRSYLADTGSGGFSLNACFPTLMSKANTEKILKLVSWQKKRDPFGLIQRSYFNKIWQERSPGESFVPTCRGCPMEVQNI